ncbi:3-dehydroquinate dehydratase II [Rubrobacter radiotolerans]|uniref:3-dehydroquinate dehydratase n=1 Tax=Rubrobacter radiotolerans TaxID=42256 RepID=A0A023X331_RUBRA|nr:type II 3-dehydroquinate dehydratase [Rubrobacter radiotolerans]AHY46748.1 3-dehydroquinate dehydratase II [Rubrobacter radiotolerans]MDX5894155.1 type II 3-dehydroquinate dehydratase [Rubrobacter radiotolerans]SMC05321.1 3-dehydroquinate dehydratase [Rubrobacter radiotolerans DSM 5868]
MTQEERQARITVLNGVNLGALGRRRPEVYGKGTLGDIEAGLREAFPDVRFTFAQTDYEGEMVGLIHAAATEPADGLVVNPGAWTHYARALHDALEAAESPVKVEVHLSNVHAREEWRRHSVVSPAVDAVVAGMGAFGYHVAVRYVLSRL